MKTEILKRLAGKYIWWKTPEEAMKTPDRIVAQVMDLGDYDDVQALIEVFGEDRLRGVLQNAEIGQFSPKSWAYWHYRLGLAIAGEVPEMPQRRVA
jgi:hypothetical protein